MTDRSKAFRERARLEADRYGPDPWIFVRELLQNSRDAGAKRVRFAVRDGGGTESVVCLDDGEGMSFEHARRYLFSLYASSKEDDRRQAGKFGVGFWSVLRFDPAAITIRSCTRGGERWGIRLDGTLEHATHVAPLERPGTEVTLERPGGDGRLEHRIHDAVWQSARYLHQRDDPDAALDVTVGDRTANAEFTLPAPSAAFRRGSVRGVVGLGPAPRVELFSRGLRVRSAACLEDLIAPAGRHTARMRVQFPELPGGLAPQALLESDELELMLSRSDARDNRALGRLVRLAQRELEMLIDRQLAHARPQTWYRRAFDWIRSRLRESLALRTALGSAVGAVTALVIAWVMWGGQQRAPAPTPAPQVTVAGAPQPRGPQPYRDLGARYRGPKVDVLAPGSAEPIELRYRPGRHRLHFASLTFSRLADDGSPNHEPVAERLSDYVGGTCTDACVEVSVPIATDGSPIRIPVPTGHRVVEGSVRLDDEAVALRSSAEGHPTIVPKRAGEGLLGYRTVAAPDPAPRRAPAVSEGMPIELARFARELRPRPVPKRVAALVSVVRELVRYDRTQATAERHAAARRDGSGFIDRTLRIGAGDCDVQNALLVALLHSAGVEARLAVGYLGADGTTVPFLHAWVEYREHDGAWSVADASEGATTGQRIASATGAAGGPAAADASGDPEVSATAPSEAEASAIAHASTGPAEAEAAVEADAATASTHAPAAADPEAMLEPPIAAPTTPEPELDRGSALGARLRELDRRWPWVVRSIPAALLGFAFWSFVSGRTRRAIKLDLGADLSRLLQGVLQQPGAFGHMSALFHRPLVPLIDDSAISLNRARELAALGRLYRTNTRPTLATRAVETGAAVLDDRTPEGRTVADALGAVDLDRWSDLLGRATDDPTMDRINDSLRSHGEDWGVRVSRGVPGGLAVLDLGPLGTQVRGNHGSRVVLLDERLPWLAQARRQAPHGPEAAAFSVVDHVAAHLDIPSDRRARLLSDAARAAVREKASS